jgi:hypothetical protein
MYVFCGTISIVENTETPDKENQMSAYVVSDDTINKVVSFLTIKTRRNNLHGYGTRRLQANGHDLSNKEDQRELAEKMFELNCESINQRYGEGEAEKFRSLNFEYHFTTQTNQYWALKALRSWLYQCCEGNVMETELYQTMEAVSCDIALAIVEQSPEYEKAPW